MADSLSFGGALPVAAIAACCESFPLSLLAMTFPLASRNESVGFASGVVTPQSDRTRGAGTPKDASDFPHSFNKPDGPLLVNFRIRRRGAKQVIWYCFRRPIAAKCSRLVWARRQIQTGSSGFAQSDESTVISDHTCSVIAGFFNRL